MPTTEGHVFFIGKTNGTNLSGRHKEKSIFFTLIQDLTNHKVHNKNIYIYIYIYIYRSN